MWECGEAGFVKLEHHPGRDFKEAFVGTCMETKLQGFTPQDVVNVLKGEGTHMWRLIWECCM